MCHRYDDQLHDIPAARNYPELKTMMADKGKKGEDTRRGCNTVANKARPETPPCCVG